MIQRCEGETDQDYAVRLHEARQEFRAARLRQLRSLRDGGLLRCHLERYFNPWPEAVQANPAAWDLAFSWRRGHGAIFASGVTGVGKTALCRCVLARAWWAGLSIAECTCPEFCTRVARYEGQERFEKMKRAEVFLFDDADKGVHSPWTLSWLWELVDFRAGMGLDTLVTANMRRDDLRETWREASKDNAAVADAIIDRLQPCLDLNLTGPDLRALPEWGTRERNTHNGL